MCCRVMQDAPRAAGRVPVEWIVEPQKTSELDMQSCAVPKARVKSISLVIYQSACTTPRDLTGHRFR